MGETASLLRRFERFKGVRDATIYLHFPCFDGLISAVLCGAFLEHSLAWSIRQYQPINYDNRSVWRSEAIDEMSAVVDFLYHPRPFFWADHHATSFVVEQDRIALRDPGERLLLYDDRCRSCAGLIWDNLKQYGLDSPRFRDMVRWANKIDSADYDSVSEAIFGGAAATEISLSLAFRSDDEYCNTLITNLAAKSLQEVAALRDVREAAMEVKRRINVGLKDAAKTARLDYGDIAVFSACQTSSALISRYSPYYFFPDARYSVALVSSEDSAKITAMRNPWKHFESIPLGEMFQHFGGGGHTRVASVLIPPGDAPKAHALLEEIVAAIHRADSKLRHPLLIVGVILAYVFGHMLQTIASTALPSSRDRAREPSKYSTTLLDPSNRVISQAQSSLYKQRLAHALA